MVQALIAGSDTRRITPEELQLVPAPEATISHQPIRHADFAQEVEQSLAMRGIQVMRQEFAISLDGMKMFGMLTTDQQFDGVNYAIGLRNSNDKSMKIGMVSGYSVIVCSNLTFSGEFTGLMAKHTSRFSLQDAVALGVDKAHRGIGSVRDQVKMLRDREITNRLARDIIYDAFVPKSGLRLPKQIMCTVHEQYFEPTIEEFQPRTAWSLINGFTEGFKELKPMRQFQATGQLTPFLLKQLN